MQMSRPELQLIKLGTDLTSGFLSTARKSFASRATHGVSTMNGTAVRFLRLGVSLSGLMILGWVLTGQAAKPARHGVPLPTDWSHSHVIFSRPATAEQVALVSEDPRYWQQRHRREDLVSSAEAADPTPGILDAASSATNGAWSENLGNNGGPGAGNYPAKFSFSSTTANCSTDYVVYSTGLIGSGTQASVVAFNNLYTTGCTGTVPLVYWAYNTGGLILTSPVLSLDGTQVAFVQTSGSPTGQAGLVLLKWKASTTESVGSPGVPTVAASAAAYHTCVAPCMYEVFLHDGHGVAVDDRSSSPFYDYTGDIAWVGGATGWLHEITGVFKGTPTEVTHATGVFPVQVNPGNPNTLSTPVYDHQSKNVFVGDAGGFFYAVNSATATVTTSAQLDHGAGLVASPILDQTNGLLYVFASSDGTTNCATVACSAVYILSTTFTGGTNGPELAVGTSVASGNTPNPLYLGSFDSTYYNSVGGTGNLYVCGDSGLRPTLYRVPILSGAFSTSALAVAALTPAAAHVACSPVSDFSNPNALGGPAERLFFSVANNGNPTACGNKGCVMNFVDTPWQPSTAYAKGQLVLVRRSNNTLWMDVAIVGGTTGASAPAWPNTVGAVTPGDGTVTWLNQGAPSVAPLAAWAKTHAYVVHNRIIDSNGNVEIVTVAGTSGGGAPAWSTTAGGLTPLDGTVTWINAGAWPNAAVPSASGAGGVIIDNSNALTGASQVYFFTLANQLCTTSGTTGACAMQASQSTLK